MRTFNFSKTYILRRPVMTSCKYKNLLTSQFHVTNIIVQILTSAILLRIIHFRKSTEKLKVNAKLEMYTKNVLPNLF